MATGVSNGDFPYVVSSPEQVNRLIREHGDLFSESQCKVCSAVLISKSQKLAHYQSKKHASKVRRYMDNKGDEPAAKILKSSSTLPTVENSGDKLCSVCNMNFSSPVVAASHYQGKVHAKNLKVKNITQSSGVLGALPSAHGKKAVETPWIGLQCFASQTNTFKPKVQPTKTCGGTESKNDPNRFCSICQASFNNPLMAQQHYVGKKHKKHLTKQKLMETYGPSPTPASTVKGYPCTVCNIELNSVEQYQAHISGSKHKNHVLQGSNVHVGSSENHRPDYRYGYGQNQAEEDWGSLRPDHDVHKGGINAYDDPSENHRPEFRYGYGREQEDEDWGSLRHDYE